MASPKTIKVQAVPTVTKLVSLPKEQHMCKKRTKQVPAYKVGKVVWSGGTKFGSFPKHD